MNCSIEFFFEKINRLKMIWTKLTYFQLLHKTLQKLKVLTWKYQIWNFLSHRLQTHRLIMNFKVLGYDQLNLNECTMINVIQMVKQKSIVYYLFGVTYAGKDVQSYYTYIYTTEKNMITFFWQMWNSADACVRINFCFAANTNKLEAIVIIQKEIWRF